MSATVALLTEDRYVDLRPGAHWYTDNIIEEDRLVIEGLAQHGIAAERHSWSDPTVDWSRFSAAIFRTTWDYFERFDEFMAFMDRIEAATDLINPASLVRWNLDKHYLLDLEDRGVHTVPSAFIERGESVDLGALMDQRGFTQAVLKPAVSGAARHTYRVQRATASELQPTLDTLLADEAMLLQPFQQQIVDVGETTLVVLDGRYSHALRKVPKPGDFRVQDDHGGTVHAYTPTTEEIEFAERAMAACQPRSLYGRIDLVRDNDGELAVMELELVEPELWFRLCADSAPRMAAGIARRLGVNIQQ